MTRRNVHVVGTGTIGEPLIGLSVPKKLESMTLPFTSALRLLVSGPRSKP